MDVTRKDKAMSVKKRLNPTVSVNFTVDEINEIRMLQERDEPKPLTSRKILDDGETWYYCTACGELIVNSKWNFCPNCGQRLDAEL